MRALTQGSACVVAWLPACPYCGGISSPAWIRTALPLPSVSCCRLPLFIKVKSAAGRMGKPATLRGGYRRVVFEAVWKKPHKNQGNKRA